MRWLLGILVNWATLMIVAGWLTKFSIDGAGVALLAAVILSIVNGIVRPILIFLTLPITVITLGLFLLVINAITLLITASFIDGFVIDGFGTAFIAGIIISILNTLIQKLVVNRVTR
ncbi:phage holin family protein [Bacillus horti]|uniref:Membrane protein n=1 Tax=Caldalkalibacillus horti TaxID=77523 RepID=A0ABT9W599_9BACI|nr:phage holin family protein [Bacillus horti]MDQ0168433.1 putative membrane protein [Bacillus horti]